MRLVSQITKQPEAQCPVGPRSFAAIASSLRSKAVISARSSALGRAIWAMFTFTPAGWFQGGLDFLSRL